MKKIARLALLLIFLLASIGVAPAAGQEDPGKPPAQDAPTSGGKIYLPLLINSGKYEVSGQVTDEEGNPLVGVTISDGAGSTARTDKNGNYTMGSNGNPSGYSFSPEKGQMGFTPSNIDVDVSGNIESLDFTGMSGCSELISNGGFETADFWIKDGASFDTSLFNNGARSLLLGLKDPASNHPSSISAITPAFTIPADAQNPLLRLWLYARSVTAASGAPSVAAPSDNFFGPNTDANDHQAMIILDANGAPLETLWEGHGQNNQDWGLVQFDLGKYTGQTIRLGFFVENDGVGSVSSLNVDDVSLGTCPTLFAPAGNLVEGSAPDGYAPSEPDACINQLVNPGFETYGGWGIPYTAYPAGYNPSSAYPNTVYAGNWSMRTGIPVYLPYQNRYSYSDVWQTVYIPTDAASATLTLYNKMVSSDAPYAPEQSQPEEGANLADTDPLFAPGVTWADQPLAYDSMYILLLNPYNGTILQTLRAWTARNVSWTQRTFDLSAYRGRSVRIQIGTYNDGWGGVTSMYVDEAYVTVCSGVVPPPPPPPPSTTCPAGYSERLANTSFEANSGWYIPVTSYSARYTTQYAYTGARSMQTGIVNPYHNRYSYSDFGQFTVVPGYETSTLLNFYAYFRSNDVGYDKQYLLVLNNWGYWIDTLLWTPAYNTSGWQQVARNLSNKPYVKSGFPFRLQFGTYNNGWGGITAMFVDDVTLCTVP